MVIENESPLSHLKCTAIVNWCLRKLIPCLDLLRETWDCKTSGEKREKRGNQLNIVQPVTETSFDIRGLGSVFH